MDDRGELCAGNSDITSSVPYLSEQGQKQLAELVVGGDTTAYFAGVLAELSPKITSLVDRLKKAGIEPRSNDSLSTYPFIMTDYAQTIKENALLRRSLTVSDDKLVPDVYLSVCMRFYYSCNHGLGQESIELEWSGQEMPISVSYDIRVNPQHERVFLPKESVDQEVYTSWEDRDYRTFAKEAAWFLEQVLNTQGLKPLTG